MEWFCTGLSRSSVRDYERDRLLFFVFRANFSSAHGTFTICFYFLRLATLKWLAWIQVCFQGVLRQPIIVSGTAETLYQKPCSSCASPPRTSHAIVRFLDHADRRIRRYIRAKQKLISAAGGGEAGPHGHAGR